GIAPAGRETIPGAAPGGAATRFAGGRAPEAPGSGPGGPAPAHCRRRSGFRPVTLRGGGAIHPARPGGPSRFRFHQRKRARGGGDLLAAGWAAPRYRAGRRPPEAAVTRGPALTPGEAPEAADGRRARPAGPAADAASYDCLELRPARRGPEDAVPPARRVRGG